MDFVYPRSNQTSQQLFPLNNNRIVKVPDSNWGHLLRVEIENVFWDRCWREIMLYLLRVEIESVFWAGETGCAQIDLLRVEIESVFWESRKFAIATNLLRVEIESVFWEEGRPRFSFEST